MISVTVPIKLPSLANPRHAGGAWAVKAQTVSAIRSAVAWHLRANGRMTIPDECSVRMTRIAPRELDDDNLRGACKPVRDEVAAWLGLPNDRDERVSWLYDQKRGAVREYAVTIEIGRRSRCAACGSFGTVA